MIRTLLVSLHAGGGVAGLLLGLWLLAPAAADRRRWLRLGYWLCLTVLVGTLVPLIALDWPDLPTGARVGFLALLGLAGVMVYRLARAEHERRTRAGGWDGRYVDHVYFTYVALWIGFLIVPALNLPLPAVSAPLTGVAVLAVGNVLLAAYKRRLGLR